MHLSRSSQRAFRQPQSWCAYSGPVQKRHTRTHVMQAFDIKRFNSASVSTRLIDFDPA